MKIKKREKSDRKPNYTNRPPIYRPTSIMFYLTETSVHLSKSFAKKNR